MNLSFTCIIRQWAHSKDVEDRRSFRIRNRVWTYSVSLPLQPKILPHVSVRQYILNSDIRKLGSKTAGESGEEIHNKSNAMIDNVQRQIEKARLGAGVRLNYTCQW